MAQALREVTRNGYTSTVDTSAWFFLIGLAFLLAGLIIISWFRLWTAGRTLRLNLVVEVNKAYAESLGVVDTPTFILFDYSGREQERWAGTAPTLEELQ